MNEMARSKAAGQVVLLEWKPLRRNSLMGFATVQYGSLKISDVSVHCLSEKLWANLPSKPQVKDGVVLTDAAGKAKYTPILEWRSREASDRFSEAVLEAIEAAHPGETRA